MIDFDDLNTDPMTSTEAIKKAAHIVNGGEASFPCPACRGTGRFVAYTGRTVGNCFKCKGAGKVSKGVAAAAKAKATRQANELAYREEHAVEINWLRERSEKGFRLASDLLSKLDAYGKFTENQLAMIRRIIAEDAERAEQRKAQWAAENDAKSGEVNISAIQALFDTATDNDIKRPIFRADGLTISKASATGANPGALYVKTTEGDTYLGKIVNGKFMAGRDANADTLTQLQAIALDPVAESIKYARRTGRCGLCGKGLVDPVSIRSGVGPVCAENWGLDWRRDAAREELANEK